MTWPKEHYRHGLASKGVSTTVNTAHRKKIAKRKEEPITVIKITNDRYTGFPWKSLLDNVQKKKLIYFDGDDDFMAYVFPKGTTTAQVEKYFVDEWGFTAEEAHDQLQVMDEITSYKKLAELMSTYS